MKLQFDEHFKKFALYLDNALAQPSHFSSLEAMMNDLLTKEVTHGDILEHGISSPLVALAHLVNNPHLIVAQGGDQGLPASRPEGNVEVSVDMLVRGAIEAVNLAPIQAVPVAAIKILGKVMEQGKLTQSQEGIGRLLAQTLDRSQHLEPVHQKEVQSAVKDAFASFRGTFPLDDNAERQIARFMHGETAIKLVTLLKFNPDNVKSLTNKERAELKRSELALG